MIDVGLMAGVKTLWHNAALQDYTLKVEDQEFQVHKVVLAAVSNFFQAMLCDSYVEGNTNSVELKGQSADAVSKLLEFIYTGDETLLSKTDDALEVLKCAMYLQMPAVSEVCAKTLVEQLNDKNCFEVLSAMIDFAFPKEVTQVKDFIQRNCESAMQSCNLETLSSGTVQLLMDCWYTCEWDKFLFVKNWIYQDYENRISFVNDLMSKVRFCLIGPEDLRAIIEMNIYGHTEEGAWHGLVVNAVKYHQQPVNLKVLDRTEQSEVRTEPLPVVYQVIFPVIPTEGRVNLLTLDKRNEWTTTKHHGFHGTAVMEYEYVLGLEVNNFLIVCCILSEIQDWQIFDPRTSTWARMPNMQKPKYFFAMVHHKDILYTIGGSNIDETPSCEVDQYSFLTNNWSSAQKMPVSLNDAAACALGHGIYVSGGEIDAALPMSDVLYCLSPSSQTPEWETRAPFLWEVWEHQMSVMKRNGEEGLIVLDNDLTLQFYSPSSNQWSEITNTARPDGYSSEWLDYGQVLLRGNSLFIFNMQIPTVIHNEDAVERKVMSWKLTIPEHSRDITKVVMPNPPDLDSGALLAISPQNIKL